MPSSVPASDVVAAPAKPLWPLFALARPIAAPQEPTLNVQPVLFDTAKPFAFGSTIALLEDEPAVAIPRLEDRAFDVAMEAPGLVAVESETAMEAKPPSATALAVEAPCELGPTATVEAEASVTAPPRLTEFVAAPAEPPRPEIAVDSAIEAPALTARELEVALALQAEPPMTASLHA
jgi:hypothetical protein